MTKVTIITCFNNKELFNQMKESCCQTFSDINSLNIIGLDNLNHKYSSAAEAYNKALEMVGQTEVVVFCHQDIIFLEGAIDNIYKICKKETLSLFGAAGVKNTGHSSNGGRIISSMAMYKQGWNYKTLPKDTIENVFTLDECLIGARKELFELVRFDEVTCNGWHLYAADLSLQCQIKNIPVKVLDANIVHLSGGKQDSTFYACEKKLAKKYRARFPKISYSCGWTYTDPIRYYFLWLYRKIRHGI